MGEIRTSRQFASSPQVPSYIDTHDIHHSPPLSEEPHLDLIPERLSFEVATHHIYPSVQNK